MLTLGAILGVMKSESKDATPIYAECSNYGSRVDTSKAEPASVWWTPGESEDGLSGFDTVECRDAFSAGGNGPFKRRIATGDMRCYSQMAMREAKSDG